MNFYDSFRKNLNILIGEYISLNLWILYFKVKSLFAIENMSPRKRQWIFFPASKFSSKSRATNFPCNYRTMNIPLRKSLRKPVYAAALERIPSALPQIEKRLRFYTPFPEQERISRETSNCLRRTPIDCSRWRYYVWELPQVPNWLWRTDIDFPKLFGHWII